MLYIPIIVGGTRRDRQSIKVARFVLARLQQRPAVQTELLDLVEFNFPIPASLPVSHVRHSFNEDGTPNDAAYEKRAANFLDEVIWFTEAIADRKAKPK
jgi:NAD(P)H-dependent FMN reductase